MGLGFRVEVSGFQYCKAYSGLGLRAQRFTGLDGLGFRVLGFKV